MCAISSTRIKVAIWAPRYMLSRVAEHKFYCEVAIYFNVNRRPLSFVTYYSSNYLNTKLLLNLFSKSDYKVIKISIVFQITSSHTY